ncbi:hypothetical protein ACWDV7_37670, partial [Streptomyces sp. NPDC003362]
MSRSPVTWLSRLRSSTAVSESKPSSLKAWSGSTASAEVCPRSPERHRLLEVEVVPGQDGFQDRAGCVVRQGEG